MIIVAGAITLVYVILLSIVLFGWNRKPDPTNNVARNRISVVIPARNESQNIGNLLADLKLQDYSDYEVIVVDDHSEDDTYLIVAGYNFPWLKVLRNSGVGKKASLTSGIESATGDIIVTTDADCRVGSSWITEINRQFFGDVAMVAGAVRLPESPALFPRLQAIEFASVIGMGGAMLKLGVPVMCNGANLAFKRDAFFKVGGYQGNEHIPSGDDEFLMRKLQSAGFSIRFCKTRNSIVTTEPQPSIPQFLEQRIRWASKWKHNTSIFASVLAVLMILVQFTTLSCIALLITDASIPALIFILSRAAVEMFVIKKFCFDLEVRCRLGDLALLQTVYPFYVVIVGVTSLFGRYNWKGRKFG